MRASIIIALAACSEPAWEWPVQAPEQQGMDSALLDGARDYAFQPGKHTQGVVVVRRGALVAEWYEPGRGADSYAASWSVAKSFTSALVGIAINEGKLALDAPLVDFYPQWAGSPRDQIQVEHVLHMATGLEWLEAYDVDMANESDVVQLVFTTASPLDYVLAKPLESAPGSVFAYSSGDTLLLSGILEQVTGMSAGDYAQSRLFSRLDITGAEWWRAKTGETLTYCCLDMTSRDFARFGLLYLQRGRWGGEQVVPEAWVDASLTSSSLYPGYGYQWWMPGKLDERLPADLVMANGYDGQFIYVIPSRELVVVRNGHYDKFDGPPVAEPSLFLKYPSNGLSPGGGTVPPDSWDHAEFLGHVLASIRD